MIAAIFNDERFPGSTWFEQAIPGAGWAHEEPHAALASQNTSMGAGVAEVWAVLDGLFFNRAELLRELGRPPDADAWSDTRLLTEAYRQWDRDLLGRVVGDFAFVIWDAARRRVFAAVDPFGLRPLCHLSKGKVLALASRTRMLRRLPESTGAVCERMVVCHLLDTYDDPAATFEDGILQVPAGHCLESRENRLAVDRYWHPGYPGMDQYANQGEVWERFESLVRVAVRERLEGAGAVGILLSGGLDSVSLAGVAADLVRRGEIASPIHSLSASFPGLGCDETASIEAVRRTLPFPGHCFEAPRRAITIDEYQSAVRRHDVPLLSEQYPVFDAFTNLAQSEGLRTILHGGGGDELTTDFGYYQEALKRGGVREFLRALNKLRRAADVSWPRAFHQMLWRYYPAPVRSFYHRARRCFGKEARRLADRSWLSINAQQMAQTIPQGIPDRKDFGSATLDICWRMLGSSVTQRACRWWVVDFQTAGIQTRAPYLDRRLFEFVFRLPQHLRPVRNDVLAFKPLLSRGLQRYLPAEFWRKDCKVNYQCYNDALFGRGIASLRRHLLEEGPWLSERWVSRNTAKQLFNELNTQGGHSAAYSLRGQRIAGLELWLRQRR